MDKSSSTKAPNKLARCIKAPIRALRRARDSYVKSMTSDRIQYGGAGLGRLSVSEFSRSQSARTSAGEEDLRELIRAASVARSARVRVEPEPEPVRRSQSVAVGRIDEDRPCDFDGDLTVGSDLLFPRSRSHAVGSKRHALGSKRRVFG